MSLTLGMLSWGAHKTLEKTLQSYMLRGLDTLADQRVIWFQEISDEDRKIAAKYGYEAIGSPTNVGIAEGYKGLVEYATGSLFLFLENDWLLLSRPDEQIITGAVLLETLSMDVIRYRRRDLPGAPLWSRQFAGKEMEHPEYLLESIHWNEFPEKFPHITALPYGWYRTTAPYAAWTNNPTMFRTDFLRDYIVPHMKGDVEIAISDWWKKTYFKVAQGDGLFTHSRLDR